MQILIDHLVTTGKIMTMEELSNVQGRAWDDVDVSTPYSKNQSYTADKLDSTNLKRVCFGR